MRAYRASAALSAAVHVLASAPRPCSTSTSSLARSLRCRCSSSMGETIQWEVDGCWKSRQCLQLAEPGTL